MHDYAAKDFCVDSLARFLHKTLALRRGVQKFYGVSWSDVCALSFGCLASSFTILITARNLALRLKRVFWEYVTRAIKYIALAIRLNVMGLSL